MKRHSLILAALAAALALTGCAENPPVNPGEGGFSTVDGSVGTGSTSDEPDNTPDEPNSTNKPESTQNEPDITPDESSIISTNKPDNTPNESSIIPTNKPENTPTPTQPTQPTQPSTTATPSKPTQPSDTATPSKPSVSPTQPVEKPPAQQGDDMITYHQCSASELKAAIEKFPLDTITLPDGSNVSKYEAISAEANDLFFDFAFFRYASPIYKTTLDDPSLIRYTDGFWEPTVDVGDLDNEINASYKKASKGDVLENGLSVKGAVCRINNRGEIVLSDLHFDGSVTVSGVINYLPEERMYTSAGTLYFRPDATKALIPILYSSREMVYHYWDGYGNGEDDPPFFMYFDGVAWVLGSINDSKYAKYDLKNAFGDKTTIPAKITVGNIKYGSLGGKRGEIIDIQF